MSINPRTWWKDGTVYQIYPASFKDSNGDGLGDIPGIISKLDYLKELGVDIIWVSPMYDSPQIDMGYDIRNYEKVYEPYGTVQDMETLVQKAHEKGMRVIMDLVINHTSDQHAWFQESRSSKENPKRDWYIWRPAKYDKDGKRMPPNNWRSAFSEPAWQWDEKTQEYYLHLFATEQPDLNWENEETRKAIYASSMTFWLERGVDGFRVDTVNMYSKGDMLDAPIVDPNNYYQPFGLVVCNGPRMHEFLREMNTQVLNKYDTMTVGELPWTPDPDHVLKYVGQGDKQLSMCFQFDLCDLGNGTDVKYNALPWTMKQVKDILNKWQNFHKGTDGWTTAFLENHDQGRSVSRYATDDPKYHVKAAKMLACLLTTMTGTVFIYQGQEIGMINAPRDWPISKYQDIESTNHYRMIAEQTGNDPIALEKAMSALQIMARDHARLPMQWTDEAPYAGFSDTSTTAEPWMPINPSYKTINVQASLNDPSSVLHFYKHLLTLRKSKPDLIIHGSFDIWPSPAGVSPEQDRVLAYSKSEINSDGTENVNAKEKLVVALNFGEEKGRFEVPEGLRKEKGWEWTVALGNYEDFEKKAADLVGKDGELRAWEGRVWVLTRQMLN